MPKYVVNKFLSISSKQRSCVLQINIAVMYSVLSIKKYVVVSRFSLHVMKMQSKEEIMLLSPVIYPKKTMTYQYPPSPALTLA